MNTVTVLAIPKGSKDPDGAWEMLKACVDDESAKLLAETRGFMPVRKSAADLFVDDGKPPSNVALVAKAVENAVNAVNAVNENYNRYIERARTIYRPVLDDVWSGKQTAAAALGGVRAQVEAVLAGGK